MNRSRGITLIALVITIIVLLILAGITIASLSGDNGILTRAKEARDKTQISSIIESAKMDILEEQVKNDGEITESELQKVFSKYFENIPADLPDNFTETTVHTKDEYGDYDIKVSDIWNGKFGEEDGGNEDGGNEEENRPGYVGPGDTAEDGNKKYESDGQIAIIPEDFTVSDKEGETSIDDGLVVIAPDGSEFVWIPVKDAIYDGETAGKTDADVPKVEGDAGVKTYTPLAVNVQTEDDPGYVTILYNFCKNGLYLKYNNYDNYYQGADIINSELEPRILGETVDTATRLGKIGLTRATFQDEVLKRQNEMILSIDYNGGFYVARYEVGLENENFVSKKGANVETGSWYNLYDKSKKFSQINVPSKSVTSNLMYNATYDAMCMWLKEKNVDITTNWDKRLTTQSAVQPSGTKYPLNDPNGEEDVVKNIYDLRGNGFEYTMNGIWESRITRGGGYFRNNYNDMGICGRWTANISDSEADAGHILTTRMVLYINDFGNESGQ